MSLQKRRPFAGAAFRFNPMPDCRHCHHLQARYYGQASTHVCEFTGGEVPREDEAEDLPCPLDLSIVGWLSPRVSCRKLALTTLRVAAQRGTLALLLEHYTNPRLKALEGLLR